MNTKNEINKLRLLQQQADSIRTKLSISPPGAVVYKAEIDMISDEIVIVESDGFGGATTKIVAGNYPIDFYTKFEITFTTENEAIRRADAIVDREIGARLAICSRQN